MFVNVFGCFAVLEQRWRAKERGGKGSAQNMDNPSPGKERAGGRRHGRGLRSEERGRGGWLFDGLSVLPHSPPQKSGTNLTS